MHKIEIPGTKSSSVDRMIQRVQNSNQNHYLPTDRFKFISEERIKTLNLTQNCAFKTLINSFSLMGDIPVTSKYETMRLNLGDSSLKNIHKQFHDKPKLRKINSLL